jgi:hypothetical protein
MLTELCPSFSCSHNIKISLYFSSRLQVLTSFLSQSFVWLETSFRVFSNPEKSFSRSIVKFVLCFVQALWRVDWLTDFVTYRFECLQHLLLLVFFLPEQLWFRSVLLGKCVWFRWLWDSPSLGASKDAFIPGIIYIFLFRWPCLIACSSKQYLSDFTNKIVNSQSIVGLLVSLWDCIL